MRVLFVAPLALVAACEGVLPKGEAPCTECLLADANNFSYTSDLAIGTLAIPEHADTRIRWDALTRDIRGGEMAGEEVREARLIAFRDLPMEEVAYGLSHDELDQADVGVYVTCAPEDASCALSEFGMFGNALDIQQYLAEGYGTWLLALGTPGAAGADALAFLAPRAGETVTEVSVTDGTSALSVAVDLKSLTPVLVPANDDALTFDWSSLRHDGLGNTLDPSTVDELWIGRFDASVDQLEADIFALERLAAHAWAMDVAGADHADLAFLGGDTPFYGIDDSGTWALALRCRTCTNPAPRLLTFLEAAE